MLKPPGSGSDSCNLTNAGSGMRKQLSRANPTAFGAGLCNRGQPYAHEWSTRRASLSSSSQPIRVQLVIITFLFVFPHAVCGSVLTAGRSHAGKSQMCCRLFVTWTINTEMQSAGSAASPRLLRGSVQGPCWCRSHPQINWWSGGGVCWAGRGGKWENADLLVTSDGFHLLSPLKTDKPELGFFQVKEIWFCNYKLGLMCRRYPL